MNQPKNGFLTSEFWTAVGVIATSVVALFVVVGKITPDQQQNFEGIIAKVIAALITLTPAALAAWKYIAARTDLKKAHLALASPSVPSHLK